MIVRWAAAVLSALGMAAAAQAEDAAGQIRAHAGEHRVIVLGERHGTREVPALVRELIEAYAADGLPVRLALELPTSENPALAAYMASTGTAEARTALRGTAYWNVRGRWHDGRRNEDVLDLVEAARALRARGRDVQAFGFDRVLPAALAGTGARDRAMAGKVRARARALPGNGRLLVLTGNLHGMRTQPEWLAYPPMTALLIYNIHIEARSGESWACTAAQRCGARPVGNGGAGSSRRDTADDRSYDLSVWLPVFSVARLLDGGPG
ncbi:calcium-binding protein [Stenotrophomonas mori]|nr:calcium-binding protein [Stenotrophomonas mori]